MVERIRTLLESRQLTPTQFADVIGVARPIVSHILSGRNKPSLEVVQRILAAMPDLAMPWLLNGTGPMLAGDGAHTAAVPPVPSVEAITPVMPAVAATPAPVRAEERRQTFVEAVVEAPKAPVAGSKTIEKENVASASPKPFPLPANVPDSSRGRVMPKRFVANTAVLEALPQLPDTTTTPSQPLAVPSERRPAVAPVQGTAHTAPVPMPTPMAEVADRAVSPQSVPAEKAPGATLASALFAGGDKPIRRIVIFYRDGSFADYQPE
ncbi:helix-turn-helix domain-containing protein [Microvirga sp. STS02]|uniref:helix-turn-helix domain-containing protein n=1 Tax=Hymenobacter negativus TaxID=2795026 RepID=UPI0018DBC39C|nr:MULTISPECIES: helix-turn-helix transcriptional regulator [Bacteria]MBH8569585.1 helix-turn-helix domain-containing protein [Hymenobacter negativus]MBR7209321.1 helix-turn-helix domain-containing protein [Microvirga sp. STS02]